MVPPIDAERLQAAWRALAGDGGGKGWRTISVELDAPCRVLAGRHFPGNEEAVIIGFRGIQILPAFPLPQGHGFQVAKLESDALGDTHTWLALSRKVGGSLDLFAMMAGDVVRLLENCSSAGKERLLQLILSRIRAWQDFMECGTDGVLGQEAEVGLFGEMVVLKGLIESGVPAGFALDAWQGPLDGLQDFTIGTGAIEVKTTVALNGFPATVSSLEQLDDSLRSPLFLAGVRLALGKSGKTLSVFAAEVRGLLQDDAAALRMFENRLVQAGFLEVMADRYVRQFTHCRTSILPVGEGFPRLTRSNVGVGIRRARYELDLDLVFVGDVGLVGALKQLGGI
jgi:Putative  PD-(D/E)XK family member, (DUF4420)